MAAYAAATRDDDAAPSTDEGRLRRGSMVCFGRMLMALWMALDSSGVLPWNVSLKYCCIGGCRRDQL